MSSFKTQAALIEFPPQFFPFQQDTVLVEGFDKPLPLYDVTMEDGSVLRLAQVRRVGIEAQLVDPAQPEEIIKVNIRQREPVRSIRMALENYIDPLGRFNFLTYLRNSVVVTVVATLITLLINSMAGFALSKYQFRGRDGILVFVHRHVDDPDFGHSGAGLSRHPFP